MLNFGDLLPDFSDYEKSAVVIFPLPYERTTSYIQGTGRAPRAIVSASHYLELYDEELKNEPYRSGLHTLQEFLPQGENPEECIKQIYEKSLPLVRSSKIIAALGGEHSLTFPIVKAFQSRYGELSVLYLDAHADLRNEYEGEKYSHACVGRRICEISPPCSLVQVGIRSLDKEEAEYLEKEKLKVFYAYETGNKGVLPAPGQFPPRQQERREEGPENWIEEVISNLSRDVYISLDLDVFDSGMMPAVGTPEPGGLSWYEIQKLLFQTARKRNVVGFDVVELVPQEGNAAPDFLAAKLVYKLIGYITSAADRQAGS